MRSVGRTVPLLVSVVSLAISQSSFAQCPQFSPGFHGGGVAGSVFDSQLFDDGTGERLYLCGSFVGAADVKSPNVVAWDGQAWRPVRGPLGTPTVGYCEALCDYDFGAGRNLVVAGHGFIASWDGHAWTDRGTSNLGAIVGICNTLLRAQGSAGEELFVGGNITSIDGVPILGVAKWSAAGWAPLGPGLAGNVRSLAVHDFGTGPKLFAAGGFTGRVSYWNGSTWIPVGQAFAPEAGLRSIASIPTGNGQHTLLAAGRWLFGDNTSVARWNGTTWISLHTQNAGMMYEITVHDAGLGPFAVFAGSLGNAGTLQRWYPGGSVNSLGSFDYGVRTTSYYTPPGHASGELFAAGEYSMVNGVLDAQRVARWDGATWRQLIAPSHSFTPTGISNSIQALHTGTAWLDPRDGRRKLVVGGAFQGNTDDPSARHLAVWDGLSWSAFPAPVTSAVRVLRTWFDPTLDREVLIGAPIVTSNQFLPVGKFDGIAWQSLGAPIGPTVDHIAVFREPGAAHAALFVFGPFWNQTLGAKYVARFDGNAWSAVGVGLEVPTPAVVVHDPPGPLGPGLYVAMKYEGAPPAQSFSRWDGSVWSSVAQGNGQFFPGNVEALGVFDDGAGEQLFATDTNRLSRFDGQAWNSYPIQQHSGDSLAVFDDGTGPALYLPDGQRFRNGQLETFAPAYSGPGANELVVFEDEYGRSPALWFIGSGAAAGEVPSRYVARLSNPCGTLARYCTGTVNSAGCTARSTWSGEPSIAQLATTPFVVAAVEVLNNKSGLFFYGLHGPVSSPFHGGSLCVRVPTSRTPVTLSAGNSGVGDCSGQLSLDFSAWVRGDLDPRIEPGSVVHGQWWYRDPASVWRSALSDGIRFEVRP